jgi:hypothetical protein
MDPKLTAFMKDVVAVLINLLSVGAYRHFARREEAQ